MSEVLHAHVWRAPWAQGHVLIPRPHKATNRFGTLPILLDLLNCHSTAREFAANSVPLLARVVGFNELHAGCDRHVLPCVGVHVMCRRGSASHARHVYVWQVMQQQKSKTLWYAGLAGELITLQQHQSPSTTASIREHAFWFGLIFCIPVNVTGSW